MSLSSVSLVMSLLGITVQKPLYRVWQQDPERVSKCETEVFLAIKKQVRDEGATVFFADKAGIGLDSSVHQPTDDAIFLHGFLRNQGADFFHATLYITGLLLQGRVIRRVAPALQVLVHRADRSP